jgi:hypothetical protein
VILLFGYKVKRWLICSKGKERIVFVVEIDRYAENISAKMLVFMKFWCFDYLNRIWLTRYCRFRRKSAYSSNQSFQIVGICNKRWSLWNPDNSFKVENSKQIMFFKSIFHYIQKMSQNRILRVEYLIYLLIKPLFMFIQWLYPSNFF